MGRCSPSRRASPALVLWACMILSSCAPADNVEALFYELDHPDNEVRFEAEQRLAQLVRDGSYDPFVRALESDNLLIRANSIVYLGQMPQPDARRALRSLLAVDRRMMLPYNPIQMKPSSEPVDSRVLVATMFQRTEPDPEAIATLLEDASVEQEPEAVIGTCLAIGALEDARGVPFLAAATGHSEVDVVRAAIEALGHVGGPEALAALVGKLRHPSRLVRIDVMSALDLWPRSESGDAIRSLGAGDESPDIRRAAIEMLVHSGGPDIVPYLIERLDDPDDSVRLAAVAGLERVTGKALKPDAAAWKAWWSQNKSSFNATL
ncbi:MAG TPA: HEAT repeat domain-containing protein [Candidatus Polarisedimenticolia bacterium]|nr:HEAT repeat domain-containing protein [Candidatus Polarisedimenticolia bacterium]